MTKPFKASRKFRAIVSLSGGMDSTTLLFYARKEGREVSAVSFVYGSRHNPFELQCAKEICEREQIPHRLICVESLFESFNSSLMGVGPIPEGHYTDESMKSTVVPGRNMIFLSVLAGIAMDEKADEIWAGVHAGDHPIYPDCRPEFIKPMQQAITAGTNGAVRLQAPFLFATKGDILKIGLALQVPYHLTRTCYTNGPIACGKCGACQERLEAFSLNKAEDPLPYLPQ